MALSRVALRLTTMEALRPSSPVTANGPWPTLGGQYVFDSRLDPVDDLSATERRAVGVVYTEDDNGDPGQKSGGPPFKRIVDLVIEVAIIALRDDTDTYTPDIPYTDAELEASLDLFEAQIRFALFYGPSGSLWRKLTGRNVTDIHSLRHASSEESARLAMRTLRMKVKIPDDEYVAAPSVVPSGNDCLPEPLKSVIAALATGSYGAKIGQGLAAKAPVMPVAAPLATVTFDLQPDSPPGPHDANKPQVQASAENLQR